MVFAVVVPPSNNSVTMRFFAPVGTWSYLGLTLFFLGPLGAVGAATVSYVRRETRSYKAFSGIKLHHDSTRQVYIHDQTIAVVELGPGKLLLNCELIEVNKPSIAQAALQDLANVSKPIKISFQDMKMLMYQCHSLENPLEVPERSDSGRGKDITDPFSIFSGILPGTRWCGTGDVATTYYDLGPNSIPDRCCRTHDLCPVKVQSFQIRYNLTNYSFYTKSHCDCDTMFYECLKASNNPTSNIMGNIYFNILQVPCVEDIDNKECRQSNSIDHMLPASAAPRKRRFRPALHKY